MCISRVLDPRDPLSIAVACAGRMRVERSSCRSSDSPLPRSWYACVGRYVQHSTGQQSSLRLGRWPGASIPRRATRFAPQDAVSPDRSSEVSHLSSFPELNAVPARCDDSCPRRMDFGKWHLRLQLAFGVVVVRLRGGVLTGLSVCVLCSKVSLELNPMHRLPSEGVEARSRQLLVQGRGVRQGQGGPGLYSPRDLLVADSGAQGDLRSLWVSWGCRAMLVPHPCA